MVALRDYPLLLQEWDKDMNGSLDPSLLKSHLKVYWKCSKSHSWRACIKDRIGKQSGCPYCHNKLADASNNLAVLFPDIAKQMHPTLNKIRPESLLPKSNKKIWWQCEMGHVWATTVASRTSGRGCPRCRVGRQISLLELRLFIELGKIFPQIIQRDRSLEVECDLYIPELKLAIEVDGHFWHKDRHDEDNRKNERIKLDGRKIIRVRETPLPVFSVHDVVFRKTDTHLSILRELCSSINTLCGCNLAIETLDEQQYHRSFCFPTTKNNLLDDSLRKEWNTGKNMPLLPDRISRHSGINVWWKCTNQHEWLASPHNRSRGAGCPYCTHRYADKHTSLAALRPSLTREWDTEANQPLTPEIVTCYSGRSVLWKCMECGWKWSARIGDRARGSRCPKCYLRKRRQKDEARKIEQKPVLESNACKKE